MKNIFAGAAILILSVSLFCKKDENKEVYTVVKEHGVLPQTVSKTNDARLKDVISKEPGNYNALVELGNLYFDNDMPEKSIDMYQRALKINPRDANVRTDMGIMYRKIRDFDRAIKEFRQSASDNPRHEQSRMNLGVVFFYDKGDAKSAIAVWDELLKLNPVNTDVKMINQMIFEAKSSGQGQQKQTGSPKSSDGWIK